MNDSVIVQPSKRYKLLNEILINMTLIDKIVTWQVVYLPNSIYIYYIIYVLYHDRDYILMILNSSAA